MSDQANEWFDRYFSEDNARRSDPLRFYPWQEDVLNRFLGIPVVESPIVPEGQMFVLNPNDLFSSILIKTAPPPPPPSRWQRLRAWLRGLLPW